VAQTSSSSNRWRLTVGALAALAIGVGAASAQAAEKKHRWKMQSAVPKSFAILGPTGQHLADKIKVTTSGSVDVRFYEPGALVPALQIFDSVSKGALESGYSSAGYVIGKFPQAAMFSSVPFGPPLGMYLAWLKYGGGNELYAEMYEPHNVKGNICHAFSPEGGGWFRKEIKSLDDLRGLKMRIAGYAANVLEKFGVSTQLLAGGDIYPALELGTIDAAEYSMPVVDLNAGFHQVAKYYYHPGWHQQVTFHEFIVNMDEWKALTDTQRQQIQIACDANLIETFAESEAANGRALAQLKAKGAEVRSYSPEILAELEKAWREVLADQSAKSPEFKKVWASFAAFREEYSGWADLAYLPTGTTARISQ
jgi:TRAP-type mannitol/chloroaromatic compound transport system substrate-binding protein